MLNLKTQKTSEQPIKRHLVYKVSINDAEIFFETGRGDFDKKRFIKEYNELFNDKQVDVSSYVYRLNFHNKIQKLRAMYFSLLYAKGENAKEAFKEMFNEDFNGKKEHFDKILAKIKFYNDKSSMIPVPKKDDKGISFSELIVLVESSRGISIDRSVSVYQFYRMYEVELQKWKNGGH